MTDVLAAIATGVGQALSWPALGLLMAGIAIGAVVGLLPGLGGTAMLAMLLPFTLSLDPVPAFALLVGAVAVLSTTGDLSSILLGVPGEAVSAAVVVDGHAMARRGEGGRAMGAALMSSLMGAVFGAFVLAAAVPIARPLLLSIESPELFMLAIVGITFMAPLVGRAPLRGLIAGAGGFWLATVGLDPVNSEPRYTFGSLFLWDGIGLLPVVLGLFAVPEAIALASPSGQSHIRASPRIDNAARGVRDAIRHWRLVLRCSAIGSYIGMVPGVGGSVAQWIAYAHATSGRAPGAPRGAIEGVLGPGAANNSTVGAALVPTLIFGIPGSVTSVVLLSAMLMKGIIPGASVLAPEAHGGHLGFVFSLVAFLVLANAVVVAVFLRLLAPLSRVATVRGSLLFPGVVVLMFVGAFMDKSALEDLLVVAGAGAIGWLMMRLDWPRPPLLLGLALGPLAENRLFLSTSLYGWSWWHRPGVLIIGAMAALFLWRGFARRAASPPDAMPGDPDADAPPSAHAAFLGALMAAAAIALAGTWTFTPRAAVFPRLALGTVLVLGIAQAVLMWHAPAGAPQIAKASGTRPSGVAWIAAMLASIWTLGFAAGAPLVVFVYLRFGAREQWWVALTQAFCMFAFLYGVLASALAVPLPTGMLFRLL